jgi:thiol-activated cytolysin
MKKLFTLVAMCLIVAAGFSQTIAKPQPAKPVTKVNNNAILIGMNQRPMRLGTIKPTALPALRRNATYVQSLRTARPTSGSAPQNQNGTNISRTKAQTKSDKSGEGSVVEKGQYCTFAQVSEANGDFTKIVLGNQNDKIYPGAIYSSNAVIEGSYNAPSGLLLKPYDITTSLFSAATAGTSSYTKVQPTIGDVYNGIAELMGRTRNVINAGNVAVEAQDIYSAEQLGFFLQADYQGFGVDLSAEFDYNKRTKRHLMFVKLTQVYFSVTLNRARGDSLISNSLSSIPSDLLYVNKVNYGRIGIIRIESDSSSEQIEAALRFAYNGNGQTAGANAGMNYGKVLANCNVRGFFFGGDAANVVEISSTTDLLRFNDYVKNGLRWDPNVAPIPISYEMKFVNDNGTAWVNSTTSYPERNCVPAKDLEITFNGVSIEDIHGGDCSYAWGSISLEVWELDPAGLKQRKVPAIEAGSNVSGNLIWSYPDGRNPQRNMINYASIRAGQSVDMNQTDGKKWLYRIDPAKVAANQVMIIVTCDINTNHKDNDFASLGFHGMKRQETRSYKLNDVLVTSVTDIKAKYGSMKPGPFASYSGSDRVHQFRAHFTVMPKN